jgi:hypothetical protein
MFAVDDIDETLERLRERGAQLVGEVVQYKDAYRLCYIRGLEGLSSDSPNNSAGRPHHNAVRLHSTLENLTPWNSKRRGCAIVTEGARRRCRPAL